MESGEAFDVEQQAEEHAREYPTRDALFAQVPGGPRCGSCGSKLVEPQHYPHEAGYRTMENPGGDWLYFHCIKCQYDTALWKLGVPR